jgi:hypothetical protein
MVLFNNGFNTLNSGFNGQGGFNNGFVQPNAFDPTANLAAAGPSSQLAYLLADQASLRNFNFSYGIGLDAALGGGPIGPIQNINNRLASEWIGGGRTDLARLLPNVNEINPLYFGPQNAQPFGFNQFQGINGGPGVTPQFPGIVNLPGASQYNAYLALQGLNQWVQPALKLYPGMG